MVHLNKYQLSEILLTACNNYQLYKAPQDMFKNVLHFKAKFSNNNASEKFAERFFVNDYEKAS